MKYVWVLTVTSFLVGFATSSLESPHRLPPPPAATATPIAASDGDPFAVGGIQMTTCPNDSIDIWPGDDIAGIINAAYPGTRFCIHGLHRPTESLAPKNGQVLFGEDDARISGARELTAWSLFESGIWVYSGEYATQENIVDVYTTDNRVACYEVSTYQDDVFYDDQRMMRVLSLDQLRGVDALPEGQGETEAEFGRFFFDYAADQIYIDQDPTAVTVDLSFLDVLVDADSRDVRIMNLTAEKARSAIIDARLGTSWKIEDVTIRFAHNTGIYTGPGEESAPFLIMRSLITNNGQAGIIGPAKFLEIRDSELSWNNIANYRITADDGECGSFEGTAGARIVGGYVGSVDQPSLRIVNLDAHHNLTDAVHTDIHAQWIVVGNSNFHDNERVGLAHEIGCEAEVAYNSFTNNGFPLKNEDSRGGGIVAFVSNYLNIHDNVFRNNWPLGVFLVHDEHANMTGIPCMVVAADDDVSDGLRHNIVENNKFALCAGFSGGSSDTDLATRDNFFIGNRYLLPDTSRFWWRDAEDLGFLTWTDWQSGGQDLTGAVYQGGACQ